MIDIGSSSLRAALYDVAGNALPGLLVRETHEFRTTPDGGVEADAAESLARLGRVLDALLSLPAVRGRRIAAVGTSTYWHNLMATDADGTPLTPVLTWADTRATAAADALRAELDPAAVHARTGCVLHPSYWPAKLRWLCETWPATFRAAQHWLSLGEWLLWRLTGRLACGISMASGTGLFDQPAADWDAALADYLGVEQGRLSPLVDADEPVGALLPAWAARWPALVGVPWFAALGDGALANVGSGCVGPGRVALSFGTSGAMRLLVESAAVEVPPGLFWYRLDRRHSLVGGALSNAGNLHAWLVDNLRVDPDAERRLGSPDGHGLTFVPLLAGERAPNWNGAARGALIGLTLHTTATDIFQAGLEAVAYRFALIWERLAPLARDFAGPVDSDAHRPAHEQPPRVVASGAAVAGSAVWGAILADTFGQPVEESSETEASSRGAALIALRGVGLLGDLDVPPPPARRVWQPDPVRHAIYRAAAERQRALYDLLFAAPAGAGAAEWAPTGAAAAARGGAA